MSLGVTPGGTTTEYRLAIIYAIGSAVVFIGSFVAACIDWLGRGAGFLGMWLSAAAAVVVYLGYVFGRATVKGRVGAARVPRQRTGLVG